MSCLISKYSLSLPLFQAQKHKKKKKSSSSSASDPWEISTVVITVEACKIGEFIYPGKDTLLGWLCHPGKQCRASGGHAAPVVVAEQDCQRFPSLIFRLMCSIKGEDGLFQKWQGYSFLWLWISCNSGGREEICILQTESCNI